MENTNIMTDYIYIPVIVFLQVAIAWAIMFMQSWAKALTSPGVAMPLQIQCHAHKSITSS